MPNMINIRNHFIQLLLITIVSLMGCDKKILHNSSDTNHLLISSLEDVQALLDNMEIMGEMPAAGEISCDDYYLPDLAFNTISANEFNTYTWQPDIYEGRTNIEDWERPYKQVFYANTVLEALPHLDAFGNLLYKNRLQGSALFMRAFAFFQIAQLYANTYNNSTANNDLGIPLRTTPNPEIPTTRSTLQASYDQIIKDLKDAAILLPATIDNNRKNRPSQAAAYGSLARVYLIMGNYNIARKYADSCLKLHSKITDYNTAISALPKPFTANQDEVIYQAHILSNTDILDHPECYIDSNLFRSYSDKDLRKSLFFKNNIQGLPVPGYNYTGTLLRFAGLATDEIILIKAECEARLGNTDKAIQDLNTLLIKRMKKGSFIALTANSTQEALAMVLQERRKELVLRGIRWSDIRRFHRENSSVTLTRNCKGQTYTLSGNDARFVLPIPPDVIRLSGVAQNPR